MICLRNDIHHIHLLGLRLTPAILLTAPPLHAMKQDPSGAPSEAEREVVDLAELGVAQLGGRRAGRGVREIM